MQLNVNTKALANHSKTLAALHRSALPTAVRATLTKAAYDVKTNTMPASAERKFINRQPNFFKANSRVEKATGWDVSSMKATVGFVPLGGTNHAVDDLQQQEHGGGIGGRALVPLKQARTGSSWNRKVKSNARISNLKSNVVDAKHAPKGKNDKEKFIRSAIHAGKGGNLIGNRTNEGGNRILFSIRSIVRKNGNTIVKSQAWHSVKKRRIVTPKPTHFMRDASLQSAEKMDKTFIAEAERQVAKYAKR